MVSTDLFFFCFSSILISYIIDPCPGLDKSWAITLSLCRYVWSWRRKLLLCVYFFGVNPSHVLSSSISLFQEMSIELSLEDVKTVALHYGFELEVSCQFWIMFFFYLYINFDYVLTPESLQTEKLNHWDNIYYES